MSLEDVAISATAFIRPDCPVEVVDPVTPTGPHYRLSFGVGEVTLYLLPADLRHVHDVIGAKLSQLDES